MSAEHVTTGPSPRISVVVPTFRRPDLCSRLLEGLAGQTVAPKCFEVIVVDDKSEDGTLEMLERLIDRVPFDLRAFSMPVNGGPAAARNAGWRAARSDLIAFIDDDCEPEPTWLASGLAALEASPRLGVAQGRTSPPQGFTGAGLPRWQHRQDICGPTIYFESCNIFYRRAALEAAGGFDESLRWWGEDTALGWGVLEAGWQSGFADGAVARHRVEQRGWAWFVQSGLNEANLVAIAKRHPLFRQQACWRPWAFRRRDAALVLAAASLLATAVTPISALGALPYLWSSRQSPRQPAFIRHWLQIMTVDAARVVGHVRGSIRDRCLVL